MKKDKQAVAGIAEGSTRRVAGACLWALALLVVWCAGTRPARAQQWTFHGTVAEGGQIDVVRGPADHIHMIAAHYYQFDVDGNVVVDEAVGDDQQGSMDFPPAIAVGDDGTVHIVTRHGGDWNGGHDIRYRRRNAAGTWDVDYLVGSRVKRNYVVSVAWTGADLVFVGSSEGGDDVWGDIHIWQAGPSSATLLGSLGGIWRADADSRMRGVAGHLFLVSGKPDGGGNAAYFLNAALPDANLVSSLQASTQSYVTGSYRTGFPDLYVDRTGTVHLVYGAQQSVYYNKYSAAGVRLLGSDVQVFDGLEWWHLESGLSAVAASDDGSRVVAVALRSDGSQGASNSALLWSYSTDGGSSWQPVLDTGHFTDGGEGRRRPRLVAVGGKFLLFYEDRANGGISLATLNLERDADQDGYPESQDCDDGNGAVHPGAEELCNGIDDDCDGDTDEGCGQDAGPQQDAGPLPDGGRTDGASQDAAREDASAAVADAGGLGRVHGGCGCEQTGSRKGGVFLFFLLAGFLFVLSRRGRLLAFSSGRRGVK